MIISRTPFRISFVGGGTDIPDFYEIHPGAVVSATIDQYMYITTHRYFEPDQIRAKYAVTETVRHPSEMRHPILREVLLAYGITGGLEISSLADIPGGTGMGSSSAFTVGLIHNLRHWLGLPVTKETLAAEACEVEIGRLKEPIGRQDQYAAAYGGFNMFRFLPGHRVETQPLSISPDIKAAFENHLLLFYTGISRSASAVLNEQKDSVAASREKFASLVHMAALCEPFVQALQAGDFPELGRLLHENWLRKRSLTQAISEVSLDAAYEAARRAGAWGGKLLGAGGGGFFLFMCPPEAQARVVSTLQHFRLISFKFEVQGSCIIYDGR
ncbi:MAG: GHMP kinase [Flavobacteriales bacterium]|nr:GHMP kinase [Flavobacteriales bacterium]MCX7650722.1 GHMP kinase [Flavobacteriales bacterium]MDW8432677.1 GHMP kinase [Flavobacteriales bacterium]